MCDAHNFMRHNASMCGGINIQAIRSHQPFVCMSPIERVLYVFQIIIAPCLHAAAFCCPWYNKIQQYTTHARARVFLLLLVAIITLNHLSHTSLSE